VRGTRHGSVGWSQCRYGYTHALGRSVRIQVGLLPDG
jgi:hypothetical protein